MTEGKLVSGFEGRNCANADCEQPLTKESGAYLHTNRDNGKLLMFCEGCSQHVQMNAALRFPLVAL